MKKIYIAVVIAAFCIMMFLSFFPWGRDISIQTVAYEYALDQEEPLAVHEVTIEGRFTCRVMGQDDFDGTVAISGIPDTQEMTAKVQFWSDRPYGMISYLDWAGQAHTKEPGFIYCSGDFEQFTIVLLEFSQNGDTQSASWDVETGRVLCANAPDHETMLSASEAVGLKLREE